MVLGIHGTIKTLFKIQNPESELKLVSEHADNLGMTHIKFQQYVQDVPVYGAVLVLHFRTDGSLSSENGTYVPDLLDIATLPNLTSEEAFAVAQKDFGQDTEVEFSGEQLTIYDEAIFSNQPAEAKLVWQFTASTSKFSSYTYYVDAQSGDVVKQGSNVIN